MRYTLRYSLKQRDFSEINILIKVTSTDELPAFAGIADKPLYSYAELSLNNIFSALTIRLLIKKGDE